MVFLKGILWFIFLNLAGCVNNNLGDKFNESELKLISKENAVVYFYQPARFIYRGLLSPIVANKIKVGAVYNGAYFKKEMAPGSYKIHAETVGFVDRIVDFNFESGKVYFVKCLVGTLWTRCFNEDKEVAIQELRETSMQLK